MSALEIPSEVDVHSFEGLTRLFRFGTSRRDNEADRNALELTEARFGLPTYDPEVQGALEDAVKHLEKLGSAQRFEKVCVLIAAASDQLNLLDLEVTNDLIRISNANEIVRFSFAPTILLCLQHAKAVQISRTKTHPTYAIRYAGIGSDVELMAFASLFLNLPIYVEVNPPWDPDALFDNEEPNSEPPDIEITFPPAELRAETAPHLEKSVRRSQLPRAVDRGRYDLESVMLEYLSDARSSALAFVSEALISSTRQSRLKIRQSLLERMRIRRVVELTTITPHMILIELGPPDEFNKTIRMMSTDAVDRFTGTVSREKEIRGKSELITVGEIRAAGDSLAPRRYLSKGPAGGSSIGALFTNNYTPTKHRLADLFEIIRPKTTRDDPVGKLRINELRPGDISENGGLSGAYRSINVKLALEAGLLEQKIKAGDILFAHRGPVGRVSYVSDADMEAGDMWAAQSLLIFRLRKQTSGKSGHPYCDPRVLFMYLLTSEVRDSWVKLAIGDRSPAIPIGEVERFGLPENLLLSKKPKKDAGTVDAVASDIYSDLILAEFKVRQANLLKVRELEASMEEGLDRVWHTAW